MIYALLLAAAQPAEIPQSAVEAAPAAPAAAAADEANRAWAGCYGAALGRSVADRGGRKAEVLVEAALEACRAEGQAFRALLQAEHPGRNTDAIFELLELGMRTDGRRLLAAAGVR